MNVFKILQAVFRRREPSVECLRLLDNGYVVVMVRACPGNYVLAACRKVQVFPPGLQIETAEPWTDVGRLADGVFQCRKEEV